VNPARNLSPVKPFTGANRRFSALSALIWRASRIFPVKRKIQWNNIHQKRLGQIVIVHSLDRLPCIIESESDECTVVWLNAAASALPHYFWFMDFEGSLCYDAIVQWRSGRRVCLTISNPIKWANTELCPDRRSSERKNPALGYLIIFSTAFIFWGGVTLFVMAVL